MEQNPHITSETNPSILIEEVLRYSREADKVFENVPTF